MLPQQLIPQGLGRGRGAGDLTLDHLGQVPSPPWGSVFPFCKTSCLVQGGDGQDEVHTPFQPSHSVIPTPLGGYRLILIPPMQTTGRERQREGCAQRQDWKPWPGPEPSEDGQPVLVQKVQHSPSHLKRSVFILQSF